jgi:hypothetical protein
MSAPPGDHVPRSAAWTVDICTLGATTDLPTAGRLLGLSRSHAYELARRGQFPIPVLRIDSRLRVSVAHLAAYLGITP